MSTQPLKHSFYRYFSLILVCSVVLISVLVIRAERLLLTRDLHDKGESIAAILSSVALDAVLRHDYATIERYTDEIMREKFVTAIAVIRADGEVLAGRRSGADEAGGLVTTHPIRLGGRRFGEVRIVFSTRRIDAITWQIVVAAVAAIIVLHGLGFLLTNMVLHKTVLKPLARLRAAISQVKGGDLGTLVAPGGPQEFAAIGASFNEMAARLRESFARIEESHRALDLERGKLAAIVGAMADGMFVTDNDAVITAFNQSAAAITGYSEAEAVGRRCEDLFKTSLCRDACALKNQGETRENVETSLITRDGRRLDVAVSSAILKDKDGNRIGGVQTFRDITEEKRRHDLYCRTEKLAAVGQLAAGVAHELNNPLSNIIGYARMVRPQTAPEKIAERIEVIVEQARRCSEIVRGLLDYSRASLSEENLVDPARVIHRVAEIISLQVRKKDIRFTVEAEQLPLLSADERKVEQVVMNLALNAVQAAPPGGRVSLRAWRDGALVRIEVADDGPGVPDDLRCRIFDPFFTTKPVGEGTGLGLAICAGIVEESGGLIELGTPEHGAVFVVSFPVAATMNETSDG